MSIRNESETAVVNGARTRFQDKVAVVTGAAQGIGEAYAEALAAEGVGSHEPVDSPDGRLRFAWVRDPAGHLLKLVQRLDR